VLDVILPGIRPEEYFDDRLGDTLDAIYLNVALKYCSVV
jgi:hypothetical protein